MPTRSSFFLICNFINSLFPFIKLNSAPDFSDNILPCLDSHKFETAIGSVSAKDDDRFDTDQ